MGAGASGAKKGVALADTGQRRAIAEVERRVLSDEKSRPDVEIDESEIVGTDVSPMVEGEIENERKYRLNADLAELSLDQILAKKDDIRKHAQAWIQNTRPPSTFVRMPNLEFAPDELLKLCYVYGYRGWDCRANLFYTVTDEILFNNGRLCVAMNPENRRQRFFKGHERDITAIAIHPVGNVAASGDSGPMPVVLVWDISSLDVLARITDLHDVGIAALCFAGNGNRLITIGRDAKATVAVWDWKNKKKAFVSQAVLNIEKVFVCACNPVDDTIVIAGSRRLKFFRLVLSGTGQRVIQQSNASVSRLTANASSAAHPSHLCIAFTQSTDSIFKQFEYSQSGLVLTGASNGTIYLWKKDANEDSIVAAHKGPVLGLASFKEGFMSCGADGRIRIWNNGLQPTNSHDIGAYLRSDQMVNAISIKGGRVAIGTKTSIILELEEDIGRFTIVLSGHILPSVNAVIAHPTRNIVATGGDDCTVRLWDFQQHVLLMTHRTPHPVYSLHFDPSGKLVAAGMKDGHWGVWVAETWEEIIQSRDRKRDVTSVKFSPNGRYLAAGSKDGFVDLYDVLADYEWTGTLQGHNDPVCALDWSLTCVYLQTCDQKNVQFLWNTKSQELVTAADVIHNMEYETWTSPVGWPVQGAVGAGDRNTCFVRSLSSTLLASGNTDGVLRLYKYPCIVTGAEPSILSIHSGAVNAVCFSFDDSYLFTVSNTDHSLFQFSITNPGDVEEVIPEAEIIGFGGSPGKGSPQKSPSKGSPTKKAPGAIPDRDTGKGLPGKQTKRSGGIISDGTLGEDGAGGEGEVPPVDPGQPEALGEPEDKVETKENEPDNRVRDEIQMVYRRGPLMSKAEKAQAAVSASARSKSQAGSSKGGGSESGAGSRTGTKEQGSADGGSATGGSATLTADSKRLPTAGSAIFASKVAPKNYLPPSDYRRPADSDEAPNCSLQLEHVYGYRGHDTRNNLFYTQSGDLVYMVGSTGIVMNIAQNSQKFFNGHTDDIVCLDISPADGTTVCSGQVGRRAYICVWDSVHMQPLQTLKGFHDFGINSVAFNNDGTLIVSVGLDSDHSIAVWNWKENAKIASSTCSVRHVFQARFSPLDDSIVTVGVRHVKFWNIRGRLLRGLNGVFDSGDQYSRMLCVCISSKGRVYSGSETGDIYRWKGNHVDFYVPEAHEGPVFTMFVCQLGVLSGGKDGVVRMWSFSMKPLMFFDMKDSSVAKDFACIRSLYWVDRSVLVGTEHSEIFQIDIENNSRELLMEGHKYGAVTAVCTHSSRGLFLTGGRDKAVRMWSVPERKMMQRKLFEHEVTSVSINFDGLSFACGLSSGTLVVMKTNNMKIIKERSDRSCELSCLQYSSNGKLLAVGCSSGDIDIYDVISVYEWIGTCKGHQSRIRSIDWSLDNAVIQSSDIDEALLHWDSESCKEILVPSEVRDIHWKSWNSPFGWPALGLAPKFGDLEGIGCVARSTFGQILAAGDDWGLIKLYKYPCCLKGARYKRYGGHSPRISCVAFTFEERNILTGGGEDGAIFQWMYLGLGRFVAADVPKSADIAEEDDQFVLQSVTAEAVDEDVEKELSVTFGRGASRLVVDRTGSIISSGGNASAAETGGKGKEGKGGAKADSDSQQDGLRLMDLVAPSTTVKVAGALNEAPYNSLQMDFVHGYRGHDTRFNLFQIKNGCLVYSVAAVAVIFNPTDNNQSFYSTHTDDIICLAMHPRGEIIASGQVGRNAIILVWDAIKLQTIVTLGDFHQRGVCSVAFSNDGNRLVSIGLDDDHSIALWSWRQGIRLAAAPVQSGKVFQCLFNPVNDSVITIGVNHVSFWTLDSTNQLSGTLGSLGQDAVCPTMMSVTATDEGMFLTGALSGDIYLWKDSRLEWQFELAHQGAVFALAPYPDGFLSGGRDAKVRMWNRLDPIKVFSFETSASSSRLPVRIRSVFWTGTQVLIGTMCSEIYTIDPASSRHRLHIQSHAAGPVRGLDTHPKQLAYATGGHDATVRVWKAPSRKCVMIRELASAVLSVAYNADGSFIACGLDNGMIYVLNSKGLSDVAQRQDRTLAINDLKFSRSGRYLATASSEGCCDVYDSMSNFELVATFRGHRSPVIFLDWSEDGAYIQSCDERGGFMYWDSMSGVQVMQDFDILRGSPWHSWTCPHGWAVTGLVPKVAGGTPVHAVCRSHRGDIIAVADDFGLVKLYRYPCVSQGSKCKRYAGHSSKILNVRFTFDDSFLVSVGGTGTNVAPVQNCNSGAGTDYSVFQWAHVDG